MNGEKYEFHKEELRYVRLIIEKGGVKRDPYKVVALYVLPVPQSTFDVRSFIGITNLYRRFITNLSRILHPLTVLTGKDVKFKWSQKCQCAFEMLRGAFVTAPVPTHFHWTKKMVVKTNASDLVSANVLSQQGKDRVLHPMAFYSKKYCPAEANNEIYDK